MTQDWPFFFAICIHLTRRHWPKKKKKKKIENSSITSVDFQRVDSVWRAQTKDKADLCLGIGRVERLKERKRTHLASFDLSNSQSWKIANYANWATTYIQVSGKILLIINKNLFYNLLEQYITSELLELENKHLIRTFKDS